ncbi:MAG: penicillin-binding transpeptidase domain-containing protein [Candidatus Zhuqueibacterota bacterium]
MKKRVTINENSLKRIAVLVVLALVFWALLVLRLFHIQIVDRGRYVEKAKNQYLHETRLRSDRGGIFDRKFRYLAINRNTWSLGVDVTKVTDPNTTADHFSKVLNKSKSYFLQKLRSERSFFWLVRGTDEAVVNQLESYKLPGVRAIKEVKRAYPQGALAAPVIGFTDIDCNGLSGVEFARNDAMKGTSGWATHLFDARGKSIPDVDYSMKKPEHGNHVVLTIDNTYQWIVEEELRFVLEQYDADAATAIISNPATGEILAMAVQPGFDPNNAGNYQPERWRNRAITDTYEPGSTFKPIVMSAILEEGLKSPDDKVFCENGTYHIYDRVIEDVHSYGWLDLRKVIKKSSNIGMAKIAQEVNKNIIYQYARDYGMGIMTGIELPGETNGELKKTVEWSKFTPIAMSYGYEVSVTPLQMVMAYGAIANGGFLLKPKIYLNDVDFQDKKFGQVQPEVIRQVISDSTSKTLISMLEDVVYEGTGKRASIQGLRIAGKTGTTKKYDPNIKKYTEDTFISSFIGFFPTEAPQLLMYVMVDNPKNENLGGEVAAPVFKRILQRILRVIEIDTPPELPKVVEKKEDSTIYAPKDDKLVTVPDVRRKRIEAAEKIVDHIDLKLVVENDGDIIKTQHPAPGTQIKRGAKLAVTLEEFGGESGNFTVVPSVIGLSLRDAVSEMSRKGLRVVVHGSGQVKRQAPEPMRKIRVGARCVVECEPAIDLAEIKSW